MIMHVHNNALLMHNGIVHLILVTLNYNILFQATHRGLHKQVKLPSSKSLKGSQNMRQSTSLKSIDHEVILSAHKESKIPFSRQFQFVFISA